MRRLRCVMFCLLAMGAASPLAGAQAAAPATAAAGPSIAPDLLARLRAQYVSEDDPNPQISENDKIRRYKAILREGGWAERQNPRAANAHEVRAMMLAAARGMVRLDPSEETEAQLLSIAQRILEAKDPPRTRIFADLLLVRQEIRKSDKADQSLALVEQFVARNSDAAIELEALLLALDMFPLIEIDPAPDTQPATTQSSRRRGRPEPPSIVDLARGKVLDRLEQEYRDRPGVANVLVQYWRRPHHLQPFKLDMQLVDGTTLSYPRDGLGRTSLLFFYSDPSSLSSYFHPVKDPYAQPAQRIIQCNAGQIVSVALGTSRDAAAQVAQKTRGWWHVFNDLDEQDPFVKKHGVPRTPACWTVGPDGRLLYMHFWDGRLGGPDKIYEAWNRTGNQATVLYDMALRIRYYRCGEFLLDEPSAFPPVQAGGVPPEKIAELDRLVWISPYATLTAADPKDKGGDPRNVRRPTALADEAKVMAMKREALARGAELLQQYPTASNLAAVRSRMLVAARWLANECRDRAAGKQARILADALLGGKLTPAEAIWPQFVQLSDQLAQDPKDAPRRILAFRDAHGGTERQWIADIFALMLALECGEEPTRAELIDELPERYRTPTLKMRGFMRDCCAINVDTGVSRYAISLDISPQVRARAFPAPLPPERRFALADQPVKAELAQLDGGTFKLPATGQAVVLHFWSLAAPPRCDTPREYDPRDDVVAGQGVPIVSVNLDEDVAKVRAYLKTRKDMDGWNHTCSGRGWRDPLARQLDIYSLPQCIVLDKHGKIAAYGNAGEFGGRVRELMGLPPKKR